MCKDVKQRILKMLSWVGILSVQVKVQLAVKPHFQCRNTVLQRETDLLRLEVAIVNSLVSSQILRCTPGNLQSFNDSMLRLKTTFEAGINSTILIGLKTRVATGVLKWSAGGD